MERGEEAIDRDDVLTIMLTLADIRANTAQTVRLLERIAGDDDEEEEADE